MMMHQGMQHPALHGLTEAGVLCCMAQSHSLWHKSGRRRNCMNHYIPLLTIILPTITNHYWNHNNFRRKTRVSCRMVAHHPKILSDRISEICLHFVSLVNLCKSLSATGETVLMGTETTWLVLRPGAESGGEGVVTARRAGMLMDFPRNFQD